MRDGFQVLAALVLVIGVALGAFLYYTGEDVDDEAVSYVIVNGIAHPVPARAAKTYVRDLQRFGGKAAVLFAEFADWFSRLWRGKALGITVIWLSVGASAMLFLLGRRV